MMRDNDYYSVARVLQIIKDYRVNAENLKEMSQEMSELKSVGVSVYGEVARDTMRE